MTKAKTPRAKRANNIPPPQTTPVALPELPAINIDPPLFVVVNKGTRSCPDCEQGKHQNCTGAAWDDGADAETVCPCSVLTGHGRQR